MQKLLDEIFGTIKRVKTGHDTRLDALESRLAELEQRPELKYLGTWERDRVYLEGTAITCKGSLWIARRATAAEPGTPESGWQLACKKGADGRDLR